MKRITVFILLLLGTIQSRAAQHEFFIATNGSDANTGTIEKPFLTPEKAVATITQMIKNGDTGAITVYFREGIYYRTDMLSLSSLISGHEEAPITIRSYKNEQVVFHGGDRINGEHFRLCKDKAILKRLLPDAQGKVWVLDLKKEGIRDYGVMKQHGFGSTPEPCPMELFIDGTPQFLARYPNEGKLLIGKIYDMGSVPRKGDFSNRGAEFGFEYDRPERWKKADDIWLHGKFSYGYNDDHLEIERIDYDKRSFKIVQPHLYGVRSNLYVDSTKTDDMAGLSVRGYYAYNLLEEIDQPGEYYLDRKSGKLYVYSDHSLAESTIEVSMMKSPFMSLENVHDVILKGITFNCSRGMGIYLYNCHDLKIDDCTFSNLGTVAVSMGQPFGSSIKKYNADGSPIEAENEDGKFENNVISNCLVFNTGTGGFYIDGGDRKTLTEGNNLVYNCEFYNTDRIKNTYSPAIKMQGVSNVIRNCYFHDLRHQAIGFKGNDLLIEYCRFDHVCDDADDMGAIYTGRDPSARGTIIQYNYFSHIEPKNEKTSMAGVYIDDGSGGMFVRNNFFFKVGNAGHYPNFAAVFMNGGHDNDIENNIFMDCNVAVGQSDWPENHWKEYMQQDFMQKRLRQDVDILGDLYQKRYPGLRNFFENSKYRLNLLKENLLIRSPLTRNGDYFLRDNLTMNGIGDTPETIDYTKAKEILPSLQAFPFEKCGLIKKPELSMNSGLDR